MFLLFVAVLFPHSPKMMSGMIVMIFIVVTKLIRIFDVHQMF